MPFQIPLEVTLEAPRNLKAISASIKKELENVKVGVDVSIRQGAATQIANMNRNLERLNTVLAVTTREATSAGNAINRLADGFNSVLGISRQFATTMTDISKSTGTVRSATFEAANAAEAFGRQAELAAKRFLAFSLSAGVIIKLSQAFQEGVSEALNFQREMVRLGQIASEPASAVKEVQVTIGQLSTSLGVASKDLINVAATFKQAGLSIADTKTALEAVAKASLAPTFTDTKNTVEGAIAAMQQFKLTASELEGVLGSVNQVAADFAVESNDIVTALQKSGGAFKAAGGTLNEFIAIFTSVRQTTRESADTIATGLRTILGRLQRPQTIEDLKALGIELRFTRQEAEAFGNLNLQEQFVGPFEAIKRISEGLKGIQETDPRFSQVVESIGGLRQLSKVIPAIKEFGVAQSALNSAIGGGASLTRTTVQAQDALLIQVQKIKEQYNQLFRDLIGSKAFNDLASGILTLASAFAKLIDTLGPAIPLLTALTAIKIGSNLGNIGRGFAESFGPLLGGRGVTRPQPKGFSRGGFVPGSGNGDTVPAMLEPGEFVLSKPAVKSLVAAKKFDKGGLTHNDFRNPVNEVLDSIEKKLGLNVSTLVDKIGFVKEATAVGGGNFGSFSTTADSKGNVTSRKINVFTGNLLEAAKRGNVSDPIEEAKFTLAHELGHALDLHIGEKIRSGKINPDINSDSRLATGQLKSIRNLGSANAELYQRQYGEFHKDYPDEEIPEEGFANLFADAVLGKTSAIGSIGNKNLVNGFNKTVQSLLKGFAKGGSVSDTIPAMLTPGEFVVNAESAAKLGNSKLNALNRGQIPGFAKGGWVGLAKGGKDKPDEVVNITEELKQQAAAQALKDAATGTTVQQRNAEVLKSKPEEVLDATLFQKMSEAAKATNDSMGKLLIVQQVIKADIDEQISDIEKSRKESKSQRKARLAAFRTGNTQENPNNLDNPSSLRAEGAPPPFQVTGTRGVSGVLESRGRTDKEIEAVLQSLAGRFAELDRATAIFTIQLGKLSGDPILITGASKPLTPGDKPDAGNATALRIARLTSERKARETEEAGILGDVSGVKLQHTLTVGRKPRPKVADLPLHVGEDIGIIPNDIDLAQHKGGSFAESPQRDDLAQAFLERARIQPPRRGIKPKADDLSFFTNPAGLSTDLGGSTTNILPDNIDLPGTNFANGPDLSDIDKIRAIRLNSKKNQSRINDNRSQLPQEVAVKDIPQLFQTIGRGKDDALEFQKALLSMNTTLTESSSVVLQLDKATKSVSILSGRSNSEANPILTSSTGPTLGIGDEGFLTGADQRRQARINARRNVSLGVLDVPNRDLITPPSNPNQFSKIFDNVTQLREFAASVGKTKPQIDEMVAGLAKFGIEIQKSTGVIVNFNKTTGAIAPVALRAGVAAPDNRGFLSRAGSAIQNQLGFGSEAPKDLGIISGIKDTIANLFKSEDLSKLSQDQIALKEAQASRRQSIGLAVGFGGQFLSSAIDSQRGPAKADSGVGFTAASAASGLVSGTSAAAGIASTFTKLPFIPTLIIGAATGIVFALEDAAKAIAQAKLDKAVTDLSERLRNASILNPNQSITSSSEDLKDLVAKANNVGGANAGVFAFENTRVEEAAKARKQALSSVAPQLLEGLNSEAGRLGKGTVFSGDEKNRTKQADELINNNGLKDIISKAAEGSGQSAAALTKQVRDALIKASLERQRQTVKDDSNKATERTINSLNLFTNSIESANRASESFSRGLSIIPGLTTGNIGALSPESQAGKLGAFGLPNNKEFTEATSTLLTPFGALGAGVKDTADSFNTAATALPAALNSITKNLTEGDSIGVKLGEALRSQLKDKLTPGLSSVINILSDKVADFSLDDLRKKVGSDVSGLSTDLIKAAFGPFQTELNNLGKAFDNEQQRIAQNLAQFRQIQQQYNQSLERIVDAQTDAAKSAAEVKSQNTGQNFFDIFTREQARRPFAEAQGNLLKGTGLGGEDAAGIGVALKETQQKLIEAQQRGATGEAAARERDALAGKAQNLRQALENLANTSKRAGDIQDRLNNLRSQEQVRGSLTSRLFTGDAKSQFDTLRGFDLTNQFKNAKDQQAFALSLSPEDRKLLAQGVEDVGGATGTNLTLQLQKAIGAGFVDANGDKKKDLEDQLAKVQAQAVEAQIANSTALGSLGTTFEKVMNESFVKNAEILAQNLKDLSNTIKQQAEGRRSAAVGALSDQKTLLSSGLSLDQLKALPTDKKFQKFVTLQEQENKLSNGSANNITPEINKVPQLFSKFITLSLNKVDTQNQVSSEFGPDLAKKFIESEQGKAALQGVGSAPQQEAETIAKLNQNLQKQLEIFIAEQKTKIGEQKNAVQLPQNIKDLGANPEFVAALNKLGGDFSKIEDAGKIFFDGTATFAGTVEQLKEILAATNTNNFVPGAVASAEQALLKAKGGSIFQPKGTDTVPAMLTPGEFVVNADATRKNAGLLHAINNGFASGGVVYRADGGFADFLERRRLGLTRGNVSVLPGSRDNTNPDINPFDAPVDNPFRIPSEAEKAKLDAEATASQNKELGQLRQNVFFNAQAATRNLQTAQTAAGLGNSEFVNQSAARGTNLREFGIRFKNELANREDELGNDRRILGGGTNTDPRLSRGPFAAAFRVAARRRTIGGGGINSSSIIGGKIDGRNDFLEEIRKRKRLLDNNDIGPAIGNGFALAAPEGFARGGIVPAYLHNGEFVVNKQATSRNLDFLNDINTGPAVPPRRFAQGGPVGSVSPSGGGGGVAANFDQFASASEALQTSIRSFAESSAKLSEAMSAFPRQISMEGKHTVEVIVNGTQALQNILPEVRELIEKESKVQLNKLLQDKFPDAGQQL